MRYYLAKSADCTVKSKDNCLYVDTPVGVLIQNYMGQTYYPSLNDAFIMAQDYNEGTSECKCKCEVKEE